MDYYRKLNIISSWGSFVGIVCGLYVNSFVAVILGLGLLVLANKLEDKARLSKGSNEEEYF